MDEAHHFGQAFGLNWRSDFPLPVFAAGEPGAPWDVSVERAAAAEAADRMVKAGSHIAIDNERIRLDPGAGDVIEILGANRVLVRQSEPAAHLPAHFFGSALAVLLARRGVVPLHASAVEIDGRAVLIFARRGSGKSSMAAALIGLGGRLISDDLSGLVVRADGCPALLPGKTGLRLYPGTRSLFRDHEGEVPPELDLGGKLRFRPPHVGGSLPVPISRILHLDAADTHIPPPFAAALLNENIFRPKTLAEVPGKQQRFAALKETVARIRVERLVGLANRDLVNFLSRAEQLVLT